MKNTNFIRDFLFGSFALLLLTTLTFAQPVVRKASGTNSDALDSALFALLLTDLGGIDNGINNSYPSGYRQITWDNITDATAADPLPRNYYNLQSPRGVVLSTACTNDTFRVSRTVASGFPVRFSEMNPNYATAFKTFSGQRLFSASPGGCNIIDVYFYIPGTATPATVTTFGLVFTDVDKSNTAGIQCFGINGEPLAPYHFANSSDNGLSLLSVSFKNGERIARVRINSGTAPLGAIDESNGGAGDVVVMDDFFYSEPRAVGQHSSDFDGDGASDYAVFRPSTGGWYVMNSGSNTFRGAQFGAPGDVPVDGDFDGDSRNDLAVFRPSNGSWYIFRSSNGQVQSAAFGQTGDKPISADYDRDGKSDIAVWRPATGTYYYLKSSNGQFTATQFGTAGDIPIGAGIQ